MTNSLGFGVFQSVFSEVFFSTVFCGLNFLNRQLSSDKGHMQILKGVVVCVLGEPTRVQYEGDLEYRTRSKIRENDAKNLEKSNALNGDLDTL